jgi:hypothetical protein
MMRESSYEIRVEGKPVRIESVPGGWVSYIRPSDYPKASAGDVRPYYVPRDLGRLAGQEVGIVKLPHHVYWGPDRWFNLTRRYQLRNAYAMLLQEGNLEDIEDYINKSILQAIWQSLTLPPRLRATWEECHEEAKTWCLQTCRTELQR